jgi:microcystin-dependent protein
MTVPKQVDFAVGTVVSDTFLDRLQELSAAGAWNCVLRITGTSVQVVASTGQDASAIVLQGHMRYVESTQTAAFTGSDASGTYGLWAVTGSDDNDPAWSLVKVAGTASPSGFAYVRKLGTVSWSGTALSALDQIAGFSKHAHLHQVGAGDELPSNAVGTTQIVASSVTTAKIADSNVTTGKIADGGVTTAKIADSNVTTGKLADFNVTTAKIADENVTTAKIADANVTAAKIASGAVGSSQLGSGAVTAAKIADGGVTTAKVSDGGVTTDKLADESVTAAKVGSATLTSTQMASSVTERLIPTGVVMPWAGTSSAPAGWLLCDGAEYPRSSYAALDAAIGSTYGPSGQYTNGSGSEGTSHLRVPDLRGRVIAGKDNMGGTAALRLSTGHLGASSVSGSTLGATGGSQTHQLLVTEMPSHTHIQLAHSHGIVDGGHTHNVGNYGLGSGTQVNGGVTNYTSNQTTFGTDLRTTGITINNATPTNLNTGGNGFHNNVQPTIIMNYIIKY